MLVNMQFAIQTKSPTLSVDDSKVYNILQRIQIVPYGTK